MGKLFLLITSLGLFFLYSDFDILGANSPTHLTNFNGLFPNTWTGDGAWDYGIVDELKAHKYKKLKRKEKLILELKQEKKTVGGPTGAN